MPNPKLIVLDTDKTRVANKILKNIIEQYNEDRTYKTATVKNMLYKPILFNYDQYLSYWKKYYTEDGFERNGINFDNNSKIFKKISYVFIDNNNPLEMIYRRKIEIDMFADFRNLKKFLSKEQISTLINVYNTTSSFDYALSQYYMYKFHGKKILLDVEKHLDKLVTQKYNEIVNYIYTELEKKFTTYPNKIPKWWKEPWDKRFCYPISLLDNKIITLDKIEGSLTEVLDKNNIIWYTC